MDKDKIQIKMVEDDAFDVIVNDELEVHIRCNDIGYSVDLYKYVPQETMEDDDYDFDGDFISGCTALFDDLDREDEEDPFNFKLIVGFNEDNDPDYFKEDFDYEVCGGTLYRGDTPLLQHAADDIPALVKRIIDDRLDEVIYIKDKEDNYLYKKEVD